MKLCFLFVGSSKGEWIADAEQEYLAKIARFLPTEAIRLKPAKLPRASSERKTADEAVALLKHIKPDDLVVACDERGESVDSRAFSNRLVKLLERGKPRVIFVIGGPYGLAQSVLLRADWRLSFSSLTFSHPLAQAVALEQVYRGLTIWKGLPYHND